MPSPTHATTPETILPAGAALLTPLMRKHGFALVQGQSGNGSGGPFATAAFVRGNRHLDLSFRYSLGLVEYHVADAVLSHEDYVLAVTGRRGAYPGFAFDPLDGFRHLPLDLERFGEIFLGGSDAAFYALVWQTLERPARRLP